MNILFLRKLFWNSLRASSCSIAIFSIAVMFFKNVPFYFQIVPHFFFACACFTHYKSCKYGLRIEHETEGYGQPYRAYFSRASLLTEQFQGLKRDLHKRVAFLTIAAGLMGPLELLRSLGKASRRESVQIDNLSPILISTILLTLGVLWYYSIKEDEKKV
jgi:hypothetical protein